MNIPVYAYMNNVEAQYVANSD